MNEAELLKNMSESTRRRNADKLNQSAAPTSGREGLDKDSSDTGEWHTEALTFALELRPRALKNSRVPRGNYAAVNDKAAVCLKEAKRLLRLQHGPKILTGQFDLEVVCYYSNKASWLDSDALSTWAMDLLKGVVLTDDKPRYIRDIIARPRLSRYGRNLVEITLTPVL